ncbi:unnamed protein product [Mucor hiemalis]
MTPPTASYVTSLSSDHISSGQPTRGTEITATAIYNNNMGGIRNVYWAYKSIMLTQSYIKSSHKTGDMYIARFLPKSLSYLVVTYLAVVRPFERLAAIIAFGEYGSLRDEAYNNYDMYLFVKNGELLQSKTLSNALGRESLSILNVSIKLSLLRHIAIAFMYYWLEHFNREISMATNGVEDDDEVGFDDQDLDLMSNQRERESTRRSDLLYNEQRGHSSSVGYRAYAVSTSDFSFLARNNLANFHLCSLEWHLFLGLNI